MSDTPRTDAAIAGGINAAHWMEDRDCLVETSRQLERELNALSAPQPSSEQWKSWTEHPAMVKEPAVYPVLVDDGSGSLETDNNLTLSFAEWRPELQRSGHSNYADKWGCGWSKSHIRYWFPLELGASLNKLNALPQPSGKEG